MAQVFRDLCRRDFQRGGFAGMLALWARTSLDLVRTTVEEHIERGIDMNREKFVRWSGWALVAGAVLFAAGLIIGSFDSYDMDPIGGVDAFYEISQVVGLVLGQLLFVIGLLGLRAGYAGRSGSLGAGLLLLAVIGSVVSLGGLLVMSSVEDGWLVWMGGYLAMTLALAVFGIVALRRRVFSRWNFAPILAGVGIPFALRHRHGGRGFGQWSGARVGCLSGGGADLRRPDPDRLPHAGGSRKNRRSRSLSRLQVYIKTREPERLPR